MSDSNEQPRRQCSLKEVLAAAEGQWRSIFARFAPELLAAFDNAGSSKHVRCPKHGGENNDAFRAYQDVAQTGGFICNSCRREDGSEGFPNGIHTLVWILNRNTELVKNDIAEFLGINIKRGRGRPAKPRDESNQPTPVKPPKPKAAPAIDNVKVAKTRKALNDRWKECRPDDGRIAAYLAHRGLTVEVPPALKLHPALAYSDDPKTKGEPRVHVGTFPAIVGIVSNKTNSIRALHRTWLANPDDAENYPGKAPVSSPKKLSQAIHHGATNGAAIRLYPLVVGQPLALTEGIETALAVHQATGVMAWSCVSAGGLSTIDLPDDAKVIEIWADPGEVGEKAAATAANRLTAEGREVYILVPPTAADDPTSPTDWLDVLRDQGAEALVAARAAAKPIIPSTDEIPTVYIHTKEHEVTDEVVRALAKDETIFCRGGALVHVVRDSARNRPGLVRDANAPRIAPLPEYRLRERITACINCVRKGADGDPIPVHPPAWLVKTIESRGDWPSIRHLESILETPVIRSDGGIVDKPGYDFASGILFEPQTSSSNATGSPFPPIPMEPTEEQVKAAVADILELVCNFPFSSDSHRSAFVAALLTPLSRHAFRGPAPLFLIDANVPGAGKSLLCDVIAIITAGRDMARMVNTQADDEMRKRITATAIGGDPIVLIDNIGDSLGTPSLDAALTATTWNDRLLGLSQNVSPPLLCTWYATGNNVVLKADISRRVCHIRLESTEENPEVRTGFKHPNIKKYAVARRPHIVAACLTLLRGFIAAGRPTQKLPPWGSFENWSDLVRQTVVWAGLQDPGLTRQDIQSDADSTVGGLTQIITAWELVDPNRNGLTAAEAIKIAWPTQNSTSNTKQFDAFGNLISSYPEQEYSKSPAEILREAITEIVFIRDGKSPNSKSLGKALTKYKGRIRSGKCFTKRTNSENVTVWTIKPITQQNTNQPGLPGIPDVPQPTLMHAVENHNSINTGSNYGLNGRVVELADRLPVNPLNPETHFPPSNPIMPPGFISEII